MLTRFMRIRNFLSSGMDQTNPSSAPPVTLPDRLLDEPLKTSSSPSTHLGFWNPGWATHPSPRNEAALVRPPKATPEQ